MPGQRKKLDKEAVLDQQHLLYLQTGTVPDWTLETWEPRYESFFDAMAEILSQGNSVMIRNGSGGRAMGIAIWRGDSRPPAKWFYDHDELNEWCEHVLRVKKAREEKQKTE